MIETSDERKEAVNQSRSSKALAGPLLAAAALAAGGGPSWILRDAVTGEGNDVGGVDVVGIVDNLMGPALLIVLAICPLAIAWGAGSMMLGGRHGPQLMVGALLAVIITAAAKGIAA